MSIEQLKIDLIHWLTELEDHQTLEELLNIKQEQQQERGSILNAEQKKELDKRLRQYNSGKTEFSDWETVKRRIQEQS